mgnify:CR=1 FL=1
MNKRFKPQHLPYNDDAHALVVALAAELGLSLKGITGAKYKTILSSFLYCVQEAGVGAYLDWSGGTTSQDTTGFSFFPATGSSTVRSVRTKLVETKRKGCVDETVETKGTSERKTENLLGEGSRRYIEKEEHRG